jgi:hypothetical protein
VVIEVDRGNALHLDIPARRQDPPRGLGTGRSGSSPVTARHRVRRPRSTFRDLTATASRSGCVSNDLVFAMKTASAVPADVSALPVVRSAMTAARRWLAVRIDDTLSLRGGRWLRAAGRPVCVRLELRRLYRLRDAALRTELYLIRDRVTQRGAVAVNLARRRRR